MSGPSGDVCYAVVVTGTMTRATTAASERAGAGAVEVGGSQEGKAGVVLSAEGEGKA